MADTSKINYTLPSGFIEFSPAMRVLELRLLDQIRAVAELYGFVGLETPSVERLSVLHAKGNQGDNLVYKITPIVDDQQLAGSTGHSRNGDSGNEERGLKFDQTVPLAAYIARNLSSITFPFARFQMDMVFRGERPKKGRYRSFRQCDFDVVGRGRLSLLYDAQMPALIIDIFDRLQIGDFLVRINNRKVLCGFFGQLGIEADAIRACVKVVDNAEKVSKEVTKAAFSKLGLSESQSSEIIEFCSIKGTPGEVLSQLREREIVSEEFQQGLQELEQVASGLQSLGAPEARYCFDMSIARGLGYYTGTVYETVLLGHEDLGTICAGGRYEDLVGIFARESMPGVGISIGWTRLFVNLVERGILTPTCATPAEVAVLCVDEKLLGHYLDMAGLLRGAGVRVVSAFEARNIGKQFRWADQLGVKVCVVVGSNEFESGSVTCKNLVTGEQVNVPKEELIEAVRSMIAR